MAWGKRACVPDVAELFYLGTVDVRAHVSTGRALTPESTVYSVGVFICHDERGVLKSDNGV